MSVGELREVPRSMEQVISIPLNLIIPDPDQPRRTFEKAAIDELAASIRKNGLLQPITVSEAGGGTFKIIAGESRWRAHKQIEAPTIKAIVQNIQGADRLVVQIIENCVRANMTALEEAAAYQRLVDELGGDVAAAATRLGKQHWRITERTCLLNLEPEYQQLLASGNLGDSQAFEMAQLPPAGQRKLFDAIRRGLCPTYNALRAVALTLREQSAQGSMFGDAAPEPSEEDRAALSRLERRIDAVCKMIAAGFDDGDLVAAKRVNPNRAASYAEKLALMRKHLLQMEHALRATAAVGVDLLGS